MAISHYRRDHLQALAFLLFAQASVVQLVKRELGVQTLAVGDGANDVNMIQCADVGVGISGQEGTQAAMASDFAVTQFAFLRRLLLVHGHRCYDKLARMALYMFYKDAVSSPFPAIIKSTLLFNSSVLSYSHQTHSVVLSEVISGYLARTPGLELLKELHFVSSKGSV